MRDIGHAILVAAIALMAVSYVWSFVLGWRKSALWFLGLAFLWLAFYPVFVARNWKEAKTNFVVFSCGLLLFVIAFVILAAANTKPPDPPIAQAHRDNVPPASTNEPASSEARIPTPQPEEAADPVSGQAAIGDAYLQERSYKLAAQHYIRAAVCGDVHSQAQLASMFRAGTGVKQDHERSFLWLRIAYAMGRTDDSTGFQMMREMDLIGREAVEKITGFGDLWEVRRPDETVSCKTAAQTAESVFRAYPFNLD